MKIINTQDGREFERSAEVSHIVFYRAGAVVLEIPVHRLEPYTTSTRGLYVEDTATDFSALHLPAAPVRAVKLNLSRHDVFYMRRKPENSWESATLALYIPDSVISVTDDGEKLATDFSGSGERNYLHAYTLHFRVSAAVRKRHIETVPDAGNDFTPPAGCKWSEQPGTVDQPTYDIIGPTRFNPARRVVKRWTETTAVSEMHIAAPYYCRTDKTPEREERERIADICKSCGINVSHYDVQMLMQRLNISVKAV